MSVFDTVCASVHLHEMNRLFKSLASGFLFVMMKIIWLCSFNIEQSLCTVRICPLGQKHHGYFTNYFLKL